MSVIVGLANMNKLSTKRTTSFINYSPNYNNSTKPNPLTGNNQPLSTSQSHNTKATNSSNSTTWDHREWTNRWWATKDNWEEYLLLIITKSNSSQKRRLRSYKLNSRTSWRGICSISMNNITSINRRNSSIREKNNASTSTSSNSSYHHNNNNHKTMSNIIISRKNNLFNSNKYKYKYKHKVSMSSMICNHRRWTTPWSATMLHKRGASPTTPSRLCLWSSISKYNCSHTSKSSMNSSITEPNTNTIDNTAIDNRSSNTNRPNSSSNTTDLSNSIIRSINNYILSSNNRTTTSPNSRPNKSSSTIWV